MTPYITTFSGRIVNPLDMQPEDIKIADIAHALALTNRFAGHTHFPINVAQHSVYVSRLCAPPFRLQGLLHDASEAYLGDITKWLKATPEFAAYRDAEDRLQILIYDVFDCTIELQHVPTVPTSVEEADRLMVRYEAELGFGSLWVPPSGQYGYTTDEERARIGRWHPWSWHEAEEHFLFEFQMYR